MAYYYDEPSRTFNEYLLVPGHTPATCIPASVSLKTPLVKYRKGEEECPLSLNIPMVSAIMAGRFRRQHGRSPCHRGRPFLHLRQPDHRAAKPPWSQRVKDYKAGLRRSPTPTFPPDMTLDEVARPEGAPPATPPCPSPTTARRTVSCSAWSPSRDYRLSRMERRREGFRVHDPAREADCRRRRTPSLKVANDIIWDHKLNSLPLVNDDEHACLYGVPQGLRLPQGRTPYELLDAHKRYVVGAGINSRDYAERVPALVEAGADVLCIDSSEGYSEWQKLTLEWVARALRRHREGRRRQRC